MKVAKDRVVGLAYQLRNDEGVLIDQAEPASPLLYLHGHNGLIIGLENALEGRLTGDSFTITVTAEEGYGEFDDNLVQRVAKDVFSGVETLEVGMRFLAETDQGSIPVEITQVDDNEVVVDGNHMLAGQNLNFQVEVMSVRIATAEELEHGHVHNSEHKHGDFCCNSADGKEGDSCNKEHGRQKQGNSNCHSGCGCKH